MAQNDWTFTLVSSSAGATFLGGTSGSAFQHSTLTNPITGAGTWCRGFFASGALSPSPYRYAGLLPINNSELTSSAGYEYGYGYSIRCWARAGTTIPSSNNAVYLTFKNQSNLSLTNAGSVNGNFAPSITAPSLTGYTLFLTETKLQLVCANSSSIATFSDSILPAQNAIGYSRTITTSNLFNRWIRLRMDVSPISGAYDRITVFTASQAQENNWQQVHTVDIPREKVGAYVPWANNPNGDGALATGKGYLGAVVAASSNTSAAYIDEFEVFKQPV
jgi:hypothetical protein